MKHDRLIRESLHENLNGLHVSKRQQQDMIETITGGKRPMKKKLSVGVLLAAALLFSLSALAAAAVGTNLFAFFADHDARFGAVADIAAQVTAEPTDIDSAALGKVNARIDSAYYDGESLAVGLCIENAVRVESYTPTAEELASAALVIDPLPITPENEEQTQAIAAFEEAVQNGTPAAFAMYQVYFSDHTAADGIDLPPYKGVEQITKDGSYAAIREFENPLPKDVQDRDSLELSVNVYESMNIRYFDGTDFRMYETKRRDAGTVTATVRRTDAETAVYSADAEGFSIEARLSPMQGSLTLTADQPIFADRSVGWLLSVTDEVNREYNVDSNDIARTDNALTFSISGSGILPDTLHVRLLFSSDDRGFIPWNPESEPLTITRTE